MKSMTLSNEKGGVGKTTQAQHIAAGLAIRGKRVILVDSDPQGHATIGLGVKKAPGIYDLLVRYEKWENVIVPVPVERYASNDTPVQGEFYIVPGNIETRAIPNVVSDPFVVRDRLEELDDLVDVVVFDTSPTPSMLHGVIYMGVDSIIYPCAPAALAIDGLMESTSHTAMANFKRQERGIDDIKVQGIIPMFIEKDHLAHDFGLRVLLENFKSRVWASVPRRTEWEKASFARKTLFAYNPSHEATSHAWAVVDRVERVL